MNQLLRQLPSTTELLAEPSIQDLLQTLRHDTVVTAVRDVLDQIRHEILENQVTETMSMEAIVQRIKATSQRFHQTTLQPVINATGILLHTGLGRSPLPKQALTAISRISEGYASVEINLDTGKRSNRASAVENKLQHYSELFDSKNYYLEFTHLCYFLKEELSTNQFELSEEKKNNLKKISRKNI